ncbi:alpha/beta hydrolase [Virgisporangium aliadipatigenens]|uniref:Alpha/beta hydrolase n=1 Tax=Virgisporangium aliadipatigenens TaxID=741659 RepID=A0A8J3YJ59_9ACTN|nr:alpha/beta hydrolase [Virgisporangium aliadipatigenens]GIJ44910.1 alpha/beta hydrolase [Virgisporangium aliadipatigenens]
MSGSTVDIDGQPIAYRDSGGTGRPVILVHGNSSSAATWTPLLDGEFGRRHRAFAIDLPGHGQSPPAADPVTYSMPGYAAVVAGFARALELRGAVYVGWSLGGHIVIEAAPLLPEPAGIAVFGTPPVAGPADLATAFLPNPAVAIGFSPEVDAAQAHAYATSFLAPGATVAPDAFTADILATDGAARGGLGASIGEGRFTDEVAIVAALPVPLAILHGTGEQLVSLDHLRKLHAPTLWRGEVQLIDGAGHAPHVETPEAFAELLGAFVADC